MNQALVALRALLKFYTHFGAGFLCGSAYIGLLAGLGFL